MAHPGCATRSLIAEAVPDRSPKGEVEYAGPSVDRVDAAQVRPRQRIRQQAEITPAGAGQLAAEPHRGIIGISNNRRRRDGRETGASGNPYRS